MASLTNNPMEEMMDEDELQQQEKASIGYRRSWSNPGPEEMQRPNTLRLCSGQKRKTFQICRYVNEMKLRKTYFGKYVKKAKH